MHMQPKPMTSSTRADDRARSAPDVAPLPAEQAPATGKTVLVTGGAGFIGSHVASFLLERGDNVVIVDEFNDYYDVTIKRSNVAALEERFGADRVAVREGDVADEAWLDSVFAERPVSAVCHLAARAGVRPSLEDPHLYVHSNVHGTVAVLECAHRHGVPHLAMASSSSVYGANSKVPFSEDDAVNGPCSQYAATKRTLELLAATYNHLYGLSVSCLRFFTVYGPSGRPDMAPFKFIDRIARGATIDQYGDGTSSRDYTYIDDIVDGVVRAIDRPLGYQIFNLGNGSPVVLTTFIRTIERHLGRDAVIRQLPNQPGDVPHTFADVARARDLLGYRPSVPLDEGIRRTVAWYRAYRERAAAEDSVAPAVLSRSLPASPVDSEDEADATRGEGADNESTASAGPGESGSGSPPAPPLMILPGSPHSAAARRAPRKGGIADRPRTAAASDSPARHRGRGIPEVPSSASILSETSSAGASDMGTPHGFVTVSPETVCARATSPSESFAVRGLVAAGGQIATCTRMHSMRRLPEDVEDKLRAFLVSSARYSSHVVVGVEGGDGMDGLRRDVQRLVDAVREAMPPSVDARFHVLAVTPWVGFAGPLNALVRHAASLGCDLVCLQSVEVVADPRAVTALAKQLRDDAVVVAGAALPGHAFAAGSRPASGTTVPWNTLALWRVRRLLATGFLSVSDGFSADGGAKGVEEVVTVAALQRLLGRKRARACLVSVPPGTVAWMADWSDPRRVARHRAKVESKRQRAQAQLDFFRAPADAGAEDALALDGAEVCHVDASTAGF